MCQESCQIEQRLLRDAEADKLGTCLPTDWPLTKTTPGGKTIEEMGRDCVASTGAKSKSESPTFPASSPSSSSVSQGITNPATAGSTIVFLSLLPTQVLNWYSKNWTVFNLAHLGHGLQLSPGPINSDFSIYSYKLIIQIAKHDLKQCLRSTLEIPVTQ